ncbi:hypothetical protein H4R24_001900 [Coemansia sp. RSA 988]|nr:hypothetical protein H4R24_001900 [Coemansia sp. RSA 988]
MELGGRASMQRTDTVRLLLYKYSQTITNLFPHVKIALITGSSNSKATEGFMSDLTDNYALQTTQLHGNIPLSITAEKFSSELTYLKMGFGTQSGQYLPKINAQALQYLNLYGLTNRFSWQQSFAFSHNTVLIAFTNLKEIDIAYGASFGEDSEMFNSNELSSSPGLEIHLPVLQKLRVVYCPANCVLLSAGVFPQYLAQARIYGSTRTLQLLDKSRLNRVGSLDVNVQSFDSDTFLYIGRQVTITNPNQVEWHNLSRLLIMSPLDIESVLALIGRLQNLTSLVSFRTIMDNIQTISDVEQSMCGISEPVVLHSKLERLAYGHIPVRGFMEETVEFIRIAIASALGACIQLLPRGVWLISIIPGGVVIISEVFTGFRTDVVLRYSVAGPIANEWPSGFEDLAAVGEEIGVRLELDQTCNQATDEEED